MNSHIDLSLLSVNEKVKVCSILDQNEEWMELGKLMGFTDFEIMVNKILFFFVFRKLLIDSL